MYITTALIKSKIYICNTISFSLFSSHTLFAEIATLTHKFTSVTLYKNKTVRYAARMHAIIACQMEFQLYPMDIQVCPIYIESCKWHTMIAFGVPNNNFITHFPASFHTLFSFYSLFLSLNLALAHSLIE